MKWINKLKTQVSEKVQKKGKELYDKASPKVQKEIDKIIATKSEDLIKTGTTIIGIGMIIIFAIRAVNSSFSEELEETTSSSARVINTYYNRVNITNNYYSKEE